MPTADAAFAGASVGPLAALAFKCAAGGTVLCLVLETESK